MQFEFAGIVPPSFILSGLTLAPSQEEIGKLLRLFEVAPVNRQVLEAALSVGFSDFEDAVIHGAACHVGAEAIVTRNTKDFKRSRIPVYSSDEMAKIVRGTGG